MDMHIVWMGLSVPLILYWSVFIMWFAKQGTFKELFKFYTLLIALTLPVWGGGVYYGLTCHCIASKLIPSQPRS